MAIKEYSAERRRARVCFLNGLPKGTDSDPFLQRGYQIKPFVGGWRGPRELAVTDSLVISQSAAKPKAIYAHLEQHALKILEFGCRIYVRVAKGVRLQGLERTTIVNILRKLRLPAAGLTSQEWETLDPEYQERFGNPLAPYVCLCDSSWSWDSIAQVIADNPAGAAPNLDIAPHAVDTNGKKLALSPERKLLLQRAFADCGEVHLQRMDGGLSGVSVFRAHVRVEGPVGAVQADGDKWWASYFVKIGQRRKIAKEYENYRDYALNYISFHLAPRLNLERCELGGREGVIVGDFVEHAEPLKDAARQGRAAHALGTLFTVTLAPWQHSLGEEERSIPEILSDILPAEIPEERKAMIRSLGKTPDLHVIRNLLNHCGQKPVRVGPIHGDLNASNVLVRLSDAILIDFEKLRISGPLLYDPASVEASLLVDGFARHRRKTTEWLSWLDSIKPLYTSREIFKLRASRHPKDGCSWFYDCVRVIRAHARQVELGPGQYATALAMALVKKSCNPEMFGDGRDWFRAAAYVLGDEVLRLVVADKQKDQA